MKKNDRYSVIGLMSGTSLDGLDVALCHFSMDNNRWSFEIEKANTFQYPKVIEQQLKLSTSLSGEELAKLDIELGQWYGQVINNFNIATHVDFIASHGHTIFHQPENRLTLQIGNGNILHADTGLPVIYDFRSLDVALGGQGAPLVPVGDELLFDDFDCCLNLGGIANISMMGNKRVAFDIAPCNMLLNYLMNSIGKSFDEGGQIARSGSINLEMLEEWNGLEFYKKSYPKSLGFEWVQQNILSRIDNDQYALQNLLNTAVEHISNQIATVINSMDKKEIKVLVTGGGAKNTYLIERINAHLNSEMKLVLPSEEVIDYKEALIFAFLGVLRVREEVNCLSSVTGASRDSSGGVMVGF